MNHAKKILVIDDDLYLRDIYYKTLKSAGFDVTLATNGRDGLDCLEKNSFDLILLDIMMPLSDGLDFLDKVKEKNLGSKNGPIILLTNVAYEEIIKEGLKKGASAYIIKTDVTPKQLLEKISEYL